MEWKRTSSFALKKKKIEKWIYIEDEVEKSFDVEVTFGKPIDILSLKEKMISNFKLEIKNMKTSRRNLFKGELERVKVCPICGEESTDAKKVLEVYNAVYCQCRKCSHCYVMYRPEKQQLEKFYIENKGYQSTYMDKKSLSTRINQVVIPKAEYVIEQYEKLYGKKPKSILDVGAGSGHFVYACRQKGIKAEGIEISKFGRQFCKENFDIELYDKDFTECYNEFNNYDIVTFWGVIEHVPNPMQMLSAAKKITSGRKTLIAIEVPRWESFGSAIQNVATDSIVRHLDPLGHINFFTDESLATAFIKSGIDISSAWYFGMDIFELINQFSYLNDNEDFINKIKKYIPNLQETIDESRLSDAMVLLGIPNDN
ncbi:class I SAM-dependent methyltransferase [Clostridium sp.]|jgi:SAM-dependent methyltransferase|uniref:class I SAM-dependent methyltransferase n=1 Tax=Clostridium sp. TaxID=1506 RepID=UPI003EEFA91F